MFLMFMGCFLFEEPINFAALKESCKDKCDQTRERESNLMSSDNLPDMAVLSDLQARFETFCRSKDLRYQVDKCKEVWKEKKREEWKECLLDCDLRYK